MVNDPKVQAAMNEFSQEAKALYYKAFIEAGYSIAIRFFIIGAVVGIAANSFMMWLLFVK